jgi:hypothetical protein
VNPIVGRLSRIRWAALFVAFLPVVAAGFLLSCGGSEPPSRLPAAPRIVAIGDLHGDLVATRRALQLAGAINENDRWVGGDLVVVQTGDQLDRGDQEREILDLLSRLSEEASRAGGALHVLNGNHELMNAALDFRYVTPTGFAEFDEFARGVEIDSLLASYPEEQRGRVVAFRPGGPYANLLAERNAVVIVGRNVFVHGGVEPRHVRYGVERLNTEIRRWLRGEGPCPEGIHDGDSVTWSRTFSWDVDDEDCRVLAGVLQDLSAERMIVGHTPHEEGIQSYCQGNVWCIDVGMAEHYGGDVQVLEITGDSVQVLSLVVAPTAEQSQTHRPVQQRQQ